MSMPTLRMLSGPTIAADRLGTRFAELHHDVGDIAKRDMSPPSCKVTCFGVVLTTRSAQRQSLGCIGPDSSFRVRTVGKHMLALSSLPDQELPQATTISRLTRCTVPLPHPTIFATLRMP